MDILTWKTKKKYANHQVQQDTASSMIHKCKTINNVKQLPSYAASGTSIQVSFEGLSWFWKYLLHFWVGKKACNNQQWCFINKLETKNIENLVCQFVNDYKNRNQFYRIIQVKHRNPTFFPFSLVVENKPYQGTNMWRLQGPLVEEIFTISPQPNSQNGERKKSMEDPPWPTSGGDGQGWRGGEREKEKGYLGRLSWGEDKPRNAVPSRTTQYRTHGTVLAASRYDSSL